MTCLDSMTFGEVKALAASLGALVGGSPSHGIFNRFVGQYCIIRASAAGVHAGEVASVSGDCVVIRNGRRLWKWKANNGIALSGVAQSGVNRVESKIDERVAEMGILGVCEIIPCTAAAKEAIDGK